MPSNETNVKEIIIMSKFIEASEKIIDGITEGYGKIENGVVGGYKKMEDTVVGGFNKMADKFVDKYLTREGESVEDAKARIAQEQKEREAARKARIEESLDASRNAGKRD